MTLWDTKIQRMGVFMWIYDGWKWGAKVSSDVDWTVWSIGALMMKYWGQVWTAPTYEMSWSRMAVFWETSD